MSYKTHIKCNYVQNDCHLHQHTPVRKFRLKNYIVLKKKSDRSGHVTGLTAGRGLHLLEILFNRLGFITRNSSTL
jgi:hypothetical protein